MSIRGRSKSPRPIQEVDVDMENPKPTSQEKPEAKVVIVTNLTRNVDQSHLNIVFGVYGQITKIDLPIFGKCKGKHNPRKYPLYTHTFHAFQPAKTEEKPPWNSSTRPQLTRLHHTWTVANSMAQFSKSNSPSFPSAQAHVLAHVRPVTGVTEDDHLLAHARARGPHRDADLPFVEKHTSHLDVEVGDCTRAGDYHGTRTGRALVPVPGHLFAVCLTVSAPGEGPQATSVEERVMAADAGLDLGVTPCDPVAPARDPSPALARVHVHCRIPHTPDIAGAEVALALPVAAGGATVVMTLGIADRDRQKTSSYILL
jgi:hypothetical protein